MRVLLVEDDVVLRGVMLRSLQDAGHRVDTAGSLEEAEYLWRVQAFDAVLLDLNLPHTAQPQSGLGSGLARAATARRCWCSRPAIGPTSASPASTRAPMTISASRSTWAKWRRDCAHWPAAAPAASTCSRAY